MKLRHLIIAVLVVVGTATISCSKKKLNKNLEGRWERIDFRASANENSSEVSEYWTFQDNEILITREYPDTAVTVDVGTYTLKIKLETKEFVAKGFGEGKYANTQREEFYNNKWVIDRLKDDVLGIYSDKDNNFLYFDFIKVE